MKSSGQAAGTPFRPAIHAECIVQMLKFCIYRILYLHRSTEQEGATNLMSINVTYSLVHITYRRSSVMLHPSLVTS